MSTATTPDTGTATPGGPAPRRSRRALLIVGGALTACAVGAGSVVWAGSTGSSSASRPGTGSSSGGGGGRPSAAARPAAALPTASLTGVQAGTTTWQRPLTLTAAGGTLTSVTATDKAGTALPGALTADGSWTSTGPLRPSTTYTLSPRANDSNGVARDLPAVVVTTTPPGKVMTASLAPGDATTVGVGEPVVVHLSTAVKDKAARAAVERNLHVSAVPPVNGAWRWMSDTEVHYRPETFWAPGTKVAVTTDLSSVQVGPDTWGGGPRSESFTIGNAVTSVADTKAHTMTVSENGAVVRVMKASMGRPQFATRNGTFVVLGKSASMTMDSATVDLPPGTPAYKTFVRDAVRLTNSGTFTHGAPWSVASQGVRNVSHGCINLSPTDAHWYFTQVNRGDVVTVVNSTTGPVLSDPGSMDWNMTFDQWRQGSALT